MFLPNASTSLFPGFCVGDKAHVVEIEAGCGLVDVGGLGAVHYGAVGDVDVMHAVHTLDSRGLDAGLAPAAYHVADVYIGKLGHIPHLLYHRSVARLGAGGAVGIRALKCDRRILYVGHHDVANVQIIGLSSTAYRALESQARVGARE